MITSLEEAITRLSYIDELKNKLAYDHFSTKQELPFACYTYDFDTSGADDYNGVQWIDFILELYALVPPNEYISNNSLTFGASALGRILLFPCSSTKFS